MFPGRGVPQKERSGKRGDRWHAASARLVPRARLRAQAASPCTARAPLARSPQRRCLHLPGTQDYPAAFAAAAWTSTQTVPGRDSARRALHCWWQQRWAEVKWGHAHSYAWQLGVACAPHSSPGAKLSPVGGSAPALTTVLTHSSILSPARQRYRCQEEKKKKRFPWLLYPISSSNLFKWKRSLEGLLLLLMYIKCILLSYSLFHRSAHILCIFCRDTERCAVLPAGTLGTLTRAASSLFPWPPSPG